MRTFLIVFLALFSVLAQAQGVYPAKAVRFVVPQPAGGAYDTVTRVLAARLQEYWRQPVVVENRAGGAGIIGTEYTAKAAPDGYTMMMGGIGPHAINVALYPKLPYDAIRDFAPVTLVGAVPLFLVVTPTLPVQSAQELAALLKRQASPMSYGSNGTGSSTHLAVEQFLHMVGAKGVHVPYKGSAPMVTALLGNQVEIAFMAVSDVLTHIKAGKIRALASGTLQRSPLLPEVPTIAEAGFAGAEASAWLGVFVPAGTPREIVARINADLKRATEEPEVRARTSAIGFDLASGTPEQLGEFVRAEIGKWTRVVKQVGVQAN